MPQADPTLVSYGRELIVNAAKQLAAAKMAVFDERTGNMYVTELGRVASHFYIRWGSSLMVVLLVLMLLRTCCSKRQAIPVLRPLATHAFLTWCWCEL